MGCITLTLQKGLNFIVQLWSLGHKVLLCTSPDSQHSSHEWELGTELKGRTWPLRSNDINKAKAQLLVVQYPAVSLPAWGNLLFLRISP